MLSTRVRTSILDAQVDARMAQPTFSVPALLMALVSATGAPLCQASALAPDDAYRDARTGVELADSAPDWPRPVWAPSKAPNILLILLDDVGFGDTGTFGGPIQTPELDRLASRGIRYNNFNTTAMCSPTRAALLSGRNHHHVGFGRVADIPDGSPGYDSVWKKNAVSVAEVLRRNGYSTAAFGKWHNTPSWEISPVGPFDRWPTGLGFEYFYGFMGAADSQWEPSTLYRGTTAVDAPGKRDTGYHLTTDITDDAIRWVQTHGSVAPDKPYLLYFATGGVHEPHHVPKKWSDLYRGQFDAGWDTLRKATFARQKKLGVIPANAELTPRPPGLPGWGTLSADQRRLYARQMEVYAGFLSHTDHEVGRLLTAVQQGPGGENTLILFIVGDNGSSGMGGLEGTDADIPLPVRLQQLSELGGPLHRNEYATGWAWAGNTPFQGMKGIASHFGGVRNPLVVSWPGHIKDEGGLRTQFTHVNDVAATFYALAGVDFPAVVDGVTQLPLDGTSFASTFDDPAAPSTHGVQYFEMWGNRAVYADGWVAALRHDTAWDAGGASSIAHPMRDADRPQPQWELYNVRLDFSQARDVADNNPEILHALQALFDVEARRNNVYPLATGADFEQILARTPSIAGDKREFVYHAGFPRVPISSGPDLARSSYRITADVAIPEAGAHGVILSWGGRAAGFALYVLDNHVVFECNSGRVRNVITSNTALPRGAAVFAYEFEQDPTQPNKGWWEPRTGIGRLYIDGRLVGENEIEQASYFTDVISVGRAYGSPVSPKFEVPFAFTGTLNKVVVNLP